MILLKAKGRHHIDMFNVPSKAQLDAGNYPKRKIKFQGLNVSIENPRGSMRSGVDPDGKPWATGMHHDYGYIKGSLGVDGDHYDCFVGPQRDCTHAYVITTKKPPDFTEDDEQKAMLGFPSEKAARDSFHMHYDDPRFLGDLVEMPMEEFKAKVMTTRENPRLLKGMILFLKPLR